MDEDLRRPEDLLPSSGPDEQPPAEDAPAKPFEGEQAEVGGSLEELDYRPTAPTLPWEIGINAYSWFIDKHPSGDVIVTFVPAIPGQQGMMFMPPAFAVRFPGQVWANFQEHVAAGEVPKPSPIQTVGADALQKLR